MAGGALKIRYTGVEVSCLLISNATAKSLSSLIGAAGAEAPDPAFGAAGVIDLTDIAYDTLSELAAVIDGYDDYTAEIFYGDDEIRTENILDAQVQAKGVDAYFLFTVVSVLAAHALITWEFCKELLVGAEDSDQIRYERMINGASTIANRIAKRYLKAKDYAEVLDGNGRDTLILPWYPVNSLGALYLDVSRVFAADTEITDYLLYGDTGVLRLPNATFPESPQAVKVTLNAGFNPVPDDLQLAVLEVVIYNFTRLAHKGPVGVRSITAPEGINTSFELTIPVNAQRVFESYMRDA